MDFIVTIEKIVHRYPLALPALGLGVGIALGAWLDLPVHWSAAGSAFLAAIFLRRSRAFLFLILLASHLFGMSAIYSEIQSLKARQLPVLKEGSAVLIGVLLEEPQIQVKGQLLKWRFLFEAEDEGLREKVWVTLVNPRGLLRLGDEVLIVGTLAKVGRTRIGAPRFRMLGIGRRSYYLLNENRLALSPFQKFSRFLSQKFDELLPEREASLMRAMILGERGAFPREWNDRFKNLGIVHILSVSGFHMAVVGFFLYFLGRLTLRGPRVSFGFVIVGLIFYYLISGEAPPALRSVIMALGFFAGRLVSREGNALNGLSLAWIASLALKPSDLFNVSFQLSYLIVLGLVLMIEFSHKASQAKGVLRKYVIEPLKISAVAFLFSYGLIAYYFGGSSPWTIVVNAVFSPLMALITLLGVLLAIGACLGEAIGGLFSLILYLPTWLMLEAVRFLANFRIFTGAKIHFPLLGVVFYYLILFAYYAQRVFKYFYTHHRRIFPQASARA